MTPQEIRCIALVAAALSSEPGLLKSAADVIARAARFEEFLRQPAEPFPWDKPTP
jgi:hypothetical protein